MTWIKYIPFEEATGRLKAIYDKYKRANDTIANIITAHSIRPHMLEGHMAFYRSVIGHGSNELPLWFLEAVGVYVSAINKCGYCIEHHSHFGGLAYDGTAENWANMTETLLDDCPEKAFDGKYLVLLGYAKALTVDPSLLNENDIANLRAAGADDGEILEVNQVTGYFSYANRTVLGLGITLANEVHAH
ncbi:alkylhydroperoxidase [Lentilitoribacter sp. Alg239-R112]|uniref:carboxymuconolactone decarboxylase family protein n=1 Tax=Lentilitoribacter sp. Alg239-R112 TaxID=2305987 RepID=UPI0018D6FFE0|nr:alkylhydroperoxidase [Lentilitoribacter sp. Alg239-R112]